jgi:hypothetical protein
MNRIGRLTLAATLAAPLFASAAESGDSDLIKNLSQSKHSLVDGIKQAEKANGAVISAKFELEDGKLSLSAFTAKDGIGKDAEHNVLMELPAVGVAEAGKSDVPSFRFDVMPELVKNCATADGCHGKQATHSVNLDLRVRSAG